MILTPDGEWYWDNERWQPTAINPTLAPPAAAFPPFVDDRGQALPNYQSGVAGPYANPMACRVVGWSLLMVLGTVGLLVLAIVANAATAPGPH